MMQTIGQKLKAVREEKQLTLEKVFEATRIRAPYLQALEADDFSSMPSPVQARGYLRNYAEYLGLDIDGLLEEVRASNTSVEIITPEDFTSQPASSALETSPVQEQTPLPTPEVDSIQESRPLDVAQDKPTPTKPKRGGRKKAKPEPIVQPQPEIVEEPVLEQPEPVVEEVIEIVQEETQPKLDVSDKVWQT
jgi:transcriptional regulator with XRE-family HTH domain